METVIHPGDEVIVMLDGVAYTAQVALPDNGHSPVVAQVRVRCCEFHNRRCEPPSELCCPLCREAAHPGHADGSCCDAPDMTGKPRWM